MKAESGDDSDVSEPISHYWEPGDFETHEKHIESRSLALFAISTLHYFFYGILFSTLQSYMSIVN